MSTVGQRDTTAAEAADQESGAPASAKRGHGHLMMIACCVPMLAIAVVLVATGVAGAGFIVVAVMCTAMMALMMAGMSRGDDSGADR